MPNLYIHGIVATQRNLPHWEVGQATYWITFRLADSIPQSKIAVWREEYEEWAKRHPQPWDDVVWAEYDERFGDRLDKWLDAGMGSCALARQDMREVVRESLLYCDGSRFELCGAVIMPTHVHCLMRPFDGYKLSALMRAIKSVSARKANQILGKSGAFWQDESYDHIVRSTEQYAHFLRYIRDNPTKANLNPTDYWLMELR